MHQQFHQLILRIFTVRHSNYDVIERCQSRGDRFEGPQHTNLKIQKRERSFVSRSHRKYLAMCPSIHINLTNRLCLKKTALIDLA